MRIANVDGRAVLLTSETTGHDVAIASGGRFGPGLMSLYDDWTELMAWATTPIEGAAVTFTREQLGPPAPTPRQIIAVGLNYSRHAAEAGFEPPEELPPVFTKFASSLTGPDTTVALPPGGHTDWEVELVVVIGKGGHGIPRDAAWRHIAGLTIGQDLSERVLQMAAQPPQFSFGKSYPGFAPTGPWLVTPDEFADRNDLRLGCDIDGETVQDGRTSDLIFPVDTLIHELSKVLTLMPGDLVFTGTPDGVGLGRTPQRWLRPGEHLHTWIEGIGEMHQTMVSADV